MNSSVVSFLRFGSTELAETVLPGLAADQFVLAESGFALATISFGVGHLIAVEVDPGIAQRRRAHRVDRRRDAAVADLPVVAGEIGVGERLAVPLQVVREAEARREVVEDHAGIGAGEVDRRQPGGRQRVGHDGRRERLVVDAVVANAELQREAVVRDGVLRVQRVVQQVVHAVAVARQVHLAAGRLRRAVVARGRGKADRRVAARVRDRRRVRVAPVAAELERVVDAHHARHEVVHVHGHAVHRTDEHALRAGPAVQLRRDDERRLRRSRGSGRGSRARSCCRRARTARRGAGGPSGRHWSPNL